MCRPHSQTQNTQHPKPSALEHDLLHSQFQQHSLLFTCLIIALKTAARVHARNPAGACFHKKCSHFMPGCSAVCRGGWRRFVADANDSLMGILQTARKRVGNSILFCFSYLCKWLHSQESKKSYHFCCKFRFESALGGLKGRGWWLESHLLDHSSASSCGPSNTFSLVQTQRASYGSCGGLCRAGCVWRAGVAGHFCVNPVFSVESALISTDALPRTQTQTEVGISQEPKKTMPKKPSQHKCRDKTQRI